jgi:hypothetical protein
MMFLEIEADSPERGTETSQKQTPSSLPKEGPRAKGSDQAASNMRSLRTMILVKQVLPLEQLYSSQVLVWCRKKVPDMKLGMRFTNDNVSRYAIYWRYV